MPSLKFSVSSRFDPRNFTIKDSELVSQDQVGINQPNCIGGRFVLDPFTSQIFSHAIHMCTIRPRWNVMRRLVLPGPHKNQCQPASLQVICTQMYKCQTVAFRKPFKVHTLQTNVPCTNTRSLHRAPVLKDCFALRRIAHPQM